MRNSKSPPVSSESPLKSMMIKQSGKSPADISKIKKDDPEADETGTYIISNSRDDVKSPTGTFENKDLEDDPEIAILDREVQN